MDNARDLAKWLGRPVVCVPRVTPRAVAPWTELMPHLAVLAQQLCAQAGV